MRLKIDWKPRKHSVEVYEAMVALHASGLGSTEIDSRLRVGSGTTYDVLKRLGLLRSRSKARELEWRQGKHRNPYTDGFSLKHNYDEKFFERDIPEMAWVLGLILSDGHVRRHDWCIAASKDLCQKVNVLVHGGHISDRKNVSYQTVSNLAMCESLRTRFCVLHDKCTTLPFPKLSHKLMPHFVRGFWDGDGCLSVVNSRTKGKIYFRASINLSSGEFLTGLWHYLLERKVVQGGSLNSYTCENRFSDKPFWLLSFGEKDTLALCKWMYAGSTARTRGDLNYEKWTKYARSYRFLTG